MKKSIYLIILISIGCSSVYTPPPIILEDLKFKEITYGICETTETSKVKSSKSPTGYQSFSTDFKIIKKTAVIPAKLNVKFGVRYKFKSKQTKNIRIKKVWVFPHEMIDNNGKKFKKLTRIMDVSTNYETFTTYQLEEEYEIVKGKWILQMFYNGKKIHERIFIVR